MVGLVVRDVYRWAASNRNRQEEQLQRCAKLGCRSASRRYSNTLVEIGGAPNERALGMQEADAIVELEIIVTCCMFEPGGLSTLR